ncbi:MAG: D-cysteine desulfhydrase family protein [Alphaproteobacteria bacterium]|nr:D-cysteine desulfhydrase family protein [Alphaproteobacteria bacterium]
MFDPSHTIPGLAAFPRQPLSQGQTPLEALPALGSELGIVLSTKRDDCQTLAFGGNKVRQLEFYFGAAVQMAADSVLITGALQSNFTRLTAAAARRLGLVPHIQLEERVAKTDPLYHSSGNLFLNQLLGAEIDFFPSGEEEAAADRALDQRAEELRAAGGRPYVIHLGLDHPPIGGLGYVAAAAELWAQLEGATERPDLIVVPSGSGLTHAGMLVGVRALGWQVAVQGIAVRRGADMQRPRVRQRAAELAAMIGRLELIDDGDILIDDSVLAPGYGQLNPATKEAITLAAGREGLLLDPVYSGRCLAGLIDLVRRGEIAPETRVLFLHTGGLPALFAYQNLMDEAQSKYE